MRPTFSIILFTVLSGAGYGLLFLLGLGLACGHWLAPYAVFTFDDFRFGHAAVTPVIEDPRMSVAIGLLAGSLLATIGLLASIAHLGQPLRAWRAFSQWRSSWLSREGVASLATYLPLAAIFWFLFAEGRDGAALPVVRTCGLLLALCSTATVYCTAHIYSCLKPIRAWNNRFVLPGYLLLGLQAGALWLVALNLPPPGDVRLNGFRWIWLSNATLIAPACALLKWKYWRWLDAPTSEPNAGIATGLDRIGSVRSFEQPHTEENYLTHEMGFVLARKHARRLRAIAFWLILLAPGTTLPLVLLIGWPAAWLALLMGMTGIFVERWLFFAEARHAVMAYYGR
jgi:DMSO reductase anchor subunit